MPTISSATTSPAANTGVSSTSSNGAIGADNGKAAPVQETSSPRADVNISSLASRLSRAENGGADTSKLSHDERAEKVRKNIEKINYQLTPENKARMAKEMPEPADASALASAAAANDYVNNISGPNPFAGLSREQLATIANDESGTFTTNEKYAAYRQAYDEEQAWRTKAVAEAMQEYHETGKLTEFFKSALAHFETLPGAEQALYPADYAADLQEKIKLDFNYFTHMPNGQPGVAPGSIASLQQGGNDNVRNLIELPDVFRPSPR